MAAYVLQTDKHISPGVILLLPYRNRKINRLSLLDLIFGDELKPGAIEKRDQLATEHFDSNDVEIRNARCLSVQLSVFCIANDSEVVSWTIHLSKGSRKHGPSSNSDRVSKMC